VIIPILSFVVLFYLPDYPFDDLKNSVLRKMFLDPKLMEPTRDGARSSYGQGPMAEKKF
jgi:hypothetical protein